MCVCIAQVITPEEVARMEAEEAARNAVVLPGVCVCVWLVGWLVGVGGYAC